MKAFRGSGAHANVMPKLFHWCDEAAYAHWKQPEGVLPDWTGSHNQLVTEGKLSRLANPSAEHAARQFPPPRLSPLIQQEIAPAAAKNIAA